MIWERSLDARSIFWPASGVPVVETTVIIRMVHTLFIFRAPLLFSPDWESPGGSRRTSQTYSVDGLRQCDGPLWNLRAPLSSGKGDYPIPRLASAGLNWKWTDSFDHDGRALFVAFAKDLAFSRHLSEKDEAFVDLTVAIREMADQENAAVPVDFDFAVCEIGDLYRDRPPSGAFGDLVHDLLRKRIEHDRPGSRNKLMLRIRPSIPAHDRVQGRQVCQSGSILALGPDADLIDQGPQLFPRALLETLKSGGGLLTAENGFFPSLGILFQCLDFGFDLLQFVP